MNAVATSSTFHLKSGSPRKYKITGDSRGTAQLHFCGDCGSALWIEWAAMPDLRILKSGIMDDEGSLNMEPKAEQYTSRRVAWLCAVGGSKQYEGEQVAGKVGEALQELKAKSGHSRIA